MLIYVNVLSLKEKGKEGGKSADGGPFHSREPGYSISVFQVDALPSKPENFMQFFHIQYIGIPYTVFFNHTP